MPDPTKIKGRPRVGVPKWAQRVTNPEPLKFPTGSTALAKRLPQFTGAGRILSGAPINMPPPPYPQLTAGGKRGVWQQIADWAAKGGKGNPPFTLPKTVGGVGGRALKSAGSKLFAPLAIAETLGLSSSETTKLLKKWFPDDPYIQATGGGLFGAGFNQEVYNRMMGIATPGETKEKGQARLDAIKAKQALDEATASKTLPLSMTQEDIDRGYKVIGGNIVPINVDANGTPYLDWASTTINREQTGTEKTFKEWGVDPGENWYFDPNTGEWKFLPKEGYVSPAEEQRMRLEQEVFDWQKMVRQEESAMEKNRQLAQLRANPASWLEYASFAGQAPSIQPWMMPLMPQQYAGSQAGGAIPGYQAGGQTMNLPQLVTPSAQYMSRLSPSARQQYYGYEGARTGQSASDVDWRLWSQSPPSGQFRGLRRTR